MSGSEPVPPPKLPDPFPRDPALDARSRRRQKAITKQIGALGLPPRVEQRALRFLEFVAPFLGIWKAKAWTEFELNLTAPDPGSLGIAFRFQKVKIQVTLDETEIVRITTDLIADPTLKRSESSVFVDLQAHASAGLRLAHHLDAEIPELWNSLRNYVERQIVERGAESGAENVDLSFLLNAAAAYAGQMPRAEA